MVRSLPLVLVLVVAIAAAPAAGSAVQPTARWSAQAACVHRHEAPWQANTGNGYFGGMQFSAQTWKRAGGQSEAAFAHPGNPSFPFAAPQREQLYRAWLLWRHDGRTWRSWGAVGAACS